MKCLMCGKYSGEYYRWYTYDNGEQFLEKVCLQCAGLHDQLVGTIKNV